MATYPRGVLADFCERHRQPVDRVGVREPSQGCCGSPTTNHKDAAGTPTCYDDCTKKWPPYLAKSGETMGEGWATVKRKDGSLQWTYDGKPLYFYSGDKKKGDKTGDGITVISFHE